MAHHLQRSNQNDVQCVSELHFGISIKAAYRIFILNNISLVGQKQQRAKLFHSVARQQQHQCRLKEDKIEILSHFLYTHEHFAIDTRLLFIRYSVYSYV